MIVMSYAEAPEGAGRGNRCRLLLRRVCVQEGITRIGEAGLEVIILGILAASGYACVWQTNRSDTFRSASQGRKCVTSSVSDSLAGTPFSFLWIHPIMLHCS